MPGFVVLEIFRRYWFSTFLLTRQGYIGKEKDVESSLVDHKFRKYVYETGWFIVRFNIV